MVFKACQFILATLALVAYLQAEKSATAHASPLSSRVLRNFVQPQDPNTVTIQPTTVPRGRTVVVSVDKSRVRVGEKVRFTLRPADLVTNPRYQVTIDFGNGTRRKINQADVSYQYGATGHYKVFASVVDSEKPPGSLDPNVQTSSIPRVTLAVSPNTAESGRPVIFSAQLSFKYPNIKYRFGFGDSSQTDWQDSSTTTHSYPAAGKYLAYVDIGLSDRGVFKQVGGSVRQPIQITGAPLGQVELVASPTPVEAGQLVTFNARVNSTDANIRYRFVFGDGSSGGWQASSQATHAYAAAGSFPAAVDIGLADLRRIVPIGRAVRPIRVMPLLPVSVTMTANPGTVEEGNAVTFTAITTSRDSNLRYRFFYGDGSSGWQNSSQSTHEYRVAGSYPAYVEVARVSGGRSSKVATSNRIQISVGPVASATPSPSVSPTSIAMSSPLPGGSAAIAQTSSQADSAKGSAVRSSLGRVLEANWWKYLLLALLVVLLGYKAFKWLFEPSPVVRAYADPGGADLEGGPQALSIECQVILRPNIAGGQYLVYTDGAEVVKNFRREDV